MKIQLLSDLHLETEHFEPAPAPGADVLVLAGDIDSTWQGLARFAGWPVPVLLVPGNHEFDGREFRTVVPRLREHAARLGLQLLYREVLDLAGADGRPCRFVATTRWSDFDTFGAAQRPRAMKAAGYFLRLMGSTRDGQPLEATGLRDEGLACRHWLEQALPLARAGVEAGAGAGTGPGAGVDAGAGTAAGAPAPGDAPPRVAVITHFAPSLRSADPRYGQQPGTASFCNADDDLLVHADLWMHGHLHVRHDYRVPRPGRAPTRVVCQARGLAKKGEDEGFDALRVIEL